MDYSKSHDSKMPMPDNYKYIWAWGIYGGKVYGSIGITVDSSPDKTYMAMSGIGDDEPKDFETWRGEK